jgi:hypothetical protein
VDLGRPCDHTTVLAGHSQRFLVQCNTADGRLSELVLDLRNRSITAVISDRDPNALGDFYIRIGNNWLEGTDDTAGHSVVIYKNWHTGEVRYPTYTGSEARSPRDLDSAALKALGPRRAEFVTAGPRALARIRAGKGYGIELNVGGRRRRIARCAGDCSPVSVSGGLALWRDRPGRLSGYVLASGKRRSWALSDAASVVGPTETRVYYGKQTPGRPGIGDYRAFSWRR